MSRSDPRPARRLREPSRQAHGFERVRAAHQREVIADLIDVTGEARAVDLAERLGVTNATVNTTLNRLLRAGLIAKERYRSIFLTDTGREMAEHSRERHAVVRAFLLKIGVDPETAETDAEGIEHHISDRTLAALRRFVSG
jgi:DtxR family manganese transport transcriptional regulator